MPYTLSEAEQLRQAERRIVQGERRVAAQRQVIETLQAQGRDTAEADRALQSFEDHVRYMIEVRSELFEAMRKAGNPPEDDRP